MHKNHQSDDQQQQHNKRTSNCVSTTKTTTTTSDNQKEFGSSVLLQILDQKSVKPARARSAYRPSKTNLFNTSSSPRSSPERPRSASAAQGSLEKEEKILLETSFNSPSLSRLTPPPLSSSGTRNNNNRVDFSFTALSPPELKGPLAAPEDLSDLVGLPDLPNQQEEEAEAEHYLEEVTVETEVDNTTDKMADIEHRPWEDEPLCNTRMKIWSAVGGVVLFLSIIIACIASSVHKVNEGNVGIYFKQGALLEEFTYPGIHCMAPFVTEMREVSIRPKTDTIYEISSITKDGIQNRFQEVQVISDVQVESLISLIRKYGMEFKDALVFDRIREELRIFCANHTIDEVYNTMFLDIVNVVKTKTERSIARLGDNGIKILNLVIPKPDIPPDIAANYRQVKVQWTEQLVAVQQQKTEAIKKQTESLKAVADAERQKAVLQIEIQKQVLQKEGDMNLSLIENDIIKKREESNADVDNYRRKSEAEANAALYTDNFIKLQMAQSLSNNTKFFFSGEQSMLGALLKNLLGDKN